MLNHQQKIRMRLAASGAPAAVKRRAVDPVHTLKFLPVFDECHNLIATLSTLIRAPFCSNLDRHTGYPEVFLVYLTQSLQTTGSTSTTPQHQSYTLTCGFILLKWTTPQRQSYTLTCGFILLKWTSPEWRHSLGRNRAHACAEGPKANGSI
jgi:hypothetical protein